MFVSSQSSWGIAGLSITGNIPDANQNELSIELLQSVKSFLCLQFSRTGLYNCAVYQITDNSPQDNSPHLHKRT